MTAISTPDRLRIESAVWTLDNRLQDLPRAARIEKRRELRANLLDAAADVGTKEALRRVGSIRRLASEYVAAQYGRWTPRPHWMSMVSFLLLGYVAMALLLDVSRSAFIDGALVGDAHLTGVAQWAGIQQVLAPLTVTFTDGKVVGAVATTGGAWEPPLYVGYLVGAALFGRVWRALPAWRRRQQPTFGDD